MNLAHERSSSPAAGSRCRDGYGPWLRAVASVVGAMLLLGASGEARAQATALGPLRTSEQNPLYRFFYVPDVEGADVVEPGRLRIDAAASYSNIFERSRSEGHDQLFDMERLTNALTLRYGVGSSFEVGARIDLQTGWGGFLDGFISGFHGTFGFPNGGRELEPEDQYRLYLNGEDPPVLFDLDRRTFALEDVRLFGKWRFLGSPEERTSLALRGTLRRSSGPLDPGRVDGAATFLGRVSGEDLTFHFGIGATTLDAPAVLEPVTASAAAYASAAVEAGLHPSVAFVVQGTAGTPYVSGFDDGELDRFPSTLVLGFAGRSGDEWSWQVSFAEDFPPDSPSVDFTVDLQLGRTF